MGERAQTQVVDRCTWKIRARAMLEGFASPVEDRANVFWRREPANNREYVQGV